MRPIRDFQEYIEEGIVKQQSPDASRARSLRKESDQTEETLKKIIHAIGVTDENANTIIKITYDSIMECIRAKMIDQGLNAAGRGAHEAEVAYLRTQGCKETDLQFLDQLRYFRNGIMYYGKHFDKDYAEKVIAFLKKMKTHKIVF